MNHRYYFDWAASAIPDDSCFENSASYGNPSSRHFEGRKAREALKNARLRCAHILNVDAKHIFFTSGGTESNSLVLLSLLRKKENGTILASSIEHSSVRENCLLLEQLGKQFSFIKTEKDGRITVDTLEKALNKNPSTRFVAVMALNNEIGSIMDIASLTNVMRKNSNSIHFHSDIVQAIGKIPLDINKWNLDSASISAHKIGGPRGIGLLYLRKAIHPIYLGGGQENGIRAGTENVSGTIALANCLEKYASNDIVKSEYQKASLRFNTLIRFLRKQDRCVLIPSDRDEDDERFSPYILQVAFKNIPGEVMVRALDDIGFSISTGSACSASSNERPILNAMGLDSKTSLEGVRISQGYTTTIEEIEALIQAIKGIIEKL